MMSVLKHIQDNFSVRELEVEKAFNDFKNIYCWSFFVCFDGYYYERLPKIVRYKGAMGLHGFHVEDKSLLLHRSNFFVEKNEVMFDVLKIDKEEKLKKIIDNSFFPKNLGFIATNSSKVFDAEKIKECILEWVALREEKLGQKILIVNDNDNCKSLFEKEDQKRYYFGFNKNTDLEIIPPPKIINL